MYYVEVEMKVDVNVVVILFLFFHNIVSWGFCLSWLEGIADVQALIIHYSYLEVRVCNAHEGEACSGQQV